MRIAIPPDCIRTRLVVSAETIMKGVGRERRDYRHVDPQSRGGRPKSGRTPDCETPGCVRTQRKGKLCEPCHVKKEG